MAWAVFIIVCEGGCSDMAERGTSLGTAYSMYRFFVCWFMIQRRAASNDGGRW